MMIKVVSVGVFLVTNDEVLRWKTYRGFKCFKFWLFRNTYITTLAHVEILRLRDATELNYDRMIKFVDVHYQTEPNLSIFITFPQKI